MYVPNSKEKVTFRFCVRNFSKRVWELYLQNATTCWKTNCVTVTPKIPGKPTKIKSWN